MATSFHLEGELAENTVFREVRAQGSVTLPDAFLGTNAANLGAAATAYDNQAIVCLCDVWKLLL
jgi:hypothetical protein